MKPEIASLLDADTTLRTIVAAVDLSTNSQRTAEYAARLARTLEAKLFLVHVAPNMPESEFPGEGRIAASETKRQRLENQLWQLAGSIKAKAMDCTPVFRVGSVSEEVLKLAAEASADLIVTGRHASAVLPSLLGWETSTKVWRRAHCPVLVYSE